jgi:hypothetical protein
LLLKVLVKSSIPKLNIGGIMPVSEDGVPYGSIDVNEVDSVEPKTDEAKAALEAFKARRDEGQEQADADAERLAEAAKAQSEAGTEPAKDEKPAAKKSASSTTDKG